MKPDERIAAIRAIANSLEGERWDDIHLIVEAFGLPRPDEFAGEKREYAYAVLKLCSDDQLETLLAYIKGDEQAAPAPETRKLPWDATDFRLFASHSTADKIAVGDIKKALRRYAIDLFVAHDDIDPSEEWLKVIELALETCDALTAYLTANFHTSSWCDHEVGLAMSRRVHIVPITLGVTPYGFMGRYQGLKADAMTAEQVASTLFDILVQHELTAARMSEAIVAFTAEAVDFAQANSGAKLLRFVTRWTPELLRKLEESTETNSQVKGSYAVPTIRSIIREHRA